MSSLVKKYPENDYILLMDEKNFPYGLKSYGFLFKRTRCLISLLLSMGVSYIILACNTLSVLVLEDVKKLYNVPIHGVTEYLGELKEGKYAVLATEQTIKTGYFQKLLKDYQASFFCKTDFISKIENNSYTKKDIDELINSLREFDFIILGCTHFIRIKHELKKELKGVISQDDNIFIDY